MDICANESDFHVVNTIFGTWLLHAETHELFEARVPGAVEKDQIVSRSLDTMSHVIKSDIQSLDAHGHLQPLNRHRTDRASPLEGANLALNINLTSVCNLGCTYCFAEGGDYGRIKGKLNTDTDLDHILTFVRANVGPGQAVRLEFFGGEPMLNYEAIEALCEKADALARERGIRFHHRISTNLTTRISERALDLFERFAFTVSVSIDGSAKTHDRNRPNLAGRGSYDTIIANCRKVRARSEAINLVARMTYVPLPGSSLMADVWDLHALNLFDWFQILPAVVSDAFLKPVFGIDPATVDRAALDQVCADKVDMEYRQLGSQYLSLFSPTNRFKGVLEIETIIRMILKGEVANGHCSGGRRYFTFSPDQSIMPCHRLVGESSFKSGAFETGVEETTTAAWRQPVTQTSVCSTCAIRYICSGGCKQENVVRTGDMNRPDPKSCRFQFRLVEMAIETIGRAGPELLGRDRSVLSDLFVSCGRPTLSNDRDRDRAPRPPLQHLMPLT